MWGFLTLALNFPLNVFVTISNKAFFKTLQFPLPVTLAAVHMLFCFFFPALLLRLGLASPPPPDSSRSSRDRRREWLLALVWALHIALSNVGLRSVSVHLFVTIKCAGPVASALLSHLLLGRPTRPSSFFSLLLLAAGPSLAARAETFSGGEEAFWGAAATAGVVLLTSLKVVLSTLLFAKNKQWDSLPLLGAMAPKACLLLLPWAAFEIVSAETPEEGKEFFSARMVALLCGSGTAAFCLNFNNFLMFKYMDSPVAVAVFTNLRKVVTILISILFFETGNVSSLNIVGMVITFVGVAWFSMHEIQEKKRVQRKTVLEEIV